MAGYMADFANPWCMHRLMQAVQALAQPADVQLSLFPDFVCKADELALDFDNFWKCAKGNDGERLTARQIDMLDAIAFALDTMNGAANAALWTDDALREDSRWERIRGDARTTLVAFGWPNEVPQNENLYIGRRSTRDRNV